MIEQRENPTNVLVCPHDRSTLTLSGEVLSCPKCNTTYRRNAGEVVDFVGPANYYWGEISQAQMERVLDCARRDGYEAAIDNLLGAEIDPSYRTSLREPTRIDWRLLLGMTTAHSALDVGAGWGRLGFALAPWIKHLYSLEYVGARLEFQKIMLEQRGDKNITLLHGSFLNLPFAANSLDWVIFNGVFEWVGLVGTEDPESMQREVLKRSFEIAKPGGHVVIAIENRWGIDSFAGAVDHSGLPFTSLMPRRVADWWVRRKQARFRNDATSPGYRTYTYSLNAYLDLCRDSGADEVRAYALLPHYNTPRAIIPVYPEAPYRAQAYAMDEIWQRASLPATLARAALAACARLGLMRHIYPHYLIVGRKPC